MSKRTDRGDSVIDEESGVGDRERQEKSIHCIAEAESVLEKT